MRFSKIYLITLFIPFTGSLTITRAAPVFEPKMSETIGHSIPYTVMSQQNYGGSHIPAGYFPMAYPSQPSFGAVYASHSPHPDHPILSAPLHNKDGNGRGSKSPGPITTSTTPIIRSKL